MKKWYTSRTLWTAILLTLANIALVATDTLPLTETWVSIMAFVNGSAMAILRVLTSEPLGK